MQKFNAPSKDYILKISAWESRMNILLIDLFTINIKNKYKSIENVQTFLTSCLGVPVLQSRGLSEDT